VVRRTNLASQAQSHLSPPRLRLEEAVIDVADHAARDSDAVSVISAACQQGLTTPTRLLATTRLRSRLKRRRLLLEVLGMPQPACDPCWNDATSGRSSVPMVSRGVAVSADS
jgi:hypothetical protein